MDAQKTGALIAQARRERGLTQKELSQALHVSAQAVSKWERGLNFPDLSLLEPLGDCLGLTVSELLSGQRGEEPKEELLRDSLRLLLGQAGRKLRRWRRLAQAFLGVLLVLALCVLVSYCGVQAILIDLLAELLRTAHRDKDNKGITLYVDVNPY